MKRIAMFVAVFIAFFSVKIVSQVINVQPGYGTLNDAIATNGWNKTYVLQAGGWYGLNATLEIDSAITIIGTPATAGQMPATLQTGSTPAGATFSFMFNPILANLTLRNVFLVNADLNNSIGVYIFNQYGKARIDLDSVTADPVGAGGLAAFNTDTVDFYMKNCLIMQHGSPTGLFDGFMWQYNGTTGFDTLYVENNTFVDVGLNFFLGNTTWQRGASVTTQDNFLWFNHNTIMFGKSDLINDFNEKSLFFTNNLLWQYGFVPYPNTGSPWFYNYGDMGPQNTITCLIKADTAFGETLPSQRKNFTEYNYNYRDPRLNDIVKLGLDSGDVSYILPLVNPSSMKDSSREARIFNDKTNFPYFSDGNNIEDQPNTDPKFNDQKIYALTDSAVIWAKYAAENLWGFSASSFPPSEQWPNYYYRADTAQGNPTTWPRFDGSYSNSQLQTASIEGLPLGDLNWFPAQKAVWKQHQADIMTHILSEDASKMNITYVKQENNQTPTSFTLSQNYPNPFNPSTVIKYSVPKSGIVTLKVYNMLGQEVATLVNQVQNSGNYIVNFNADGLASGVYMYRIQSGDFSLTKKMELLK